MVKDKEDDEGLEEEGDDVEDTKLPRAIRNAIGRSVAGMEKRMIDALSKTVNSKLDEAVSAIRTAGQNDDLGLDDEVDGESAEDDDEEMVKYKGKWMKESEYLAAKSGKDGKSSGDEERQPSRKEIFQGHVEAVYTRLLPENYGINSDKVRQKAVELVRKAYQRQDGNIDIVILDETKAELQAQKEGKTVDLIVANFAEQRFPKPFARIQAAVNPVKKEGKVDTGKGNAKVGAEDEEVEEEAEAGEESEEAEEEVAGDKPKGRTAPRKTEESKAVKEDGELAGASKTGTKNPPSKNIAKAVNKQADEAIDKIHAQYYGAQPLPKG